MMEQADDSDGVVLWHSRFSTDTLLIARLSASLKSP